ncbi:type II toxin-antitoxin system HicA family toxin [Ferrovum sp.]|uniref:type II toxin-antitoxin system HicA family toxin n=1 Tax=Ferrovum sp. TaxID=2609467 RepID=UPI002602AB2A|nr:type II toxin-antitoxin system HicA family toxin [Ferrovum sp.]
MRECAVETGYIEKFAHCNYFSVTLIDELENHMSKHEKNLKKLCASPTPADIKWDELVGVLKKLGYTLQRSDGSRRKFYHEGKDALIICHQPHPLPDVDKGCVADVVEHLKNYEFID